MEFKLSQLSFSDLFDILELIEEELYISKMSEMTLMLFQIRHCIFTYSLTEPEKAIPFLLIVLY